MLLSHQHAFKFTHKSADGKQTEQKAPKSKQLYAAVDSEDLDVGACWLCEVGGCSFSCQHRQTTHGACLLLLLLPPTCHCWQRCLLCSLATITLWCSSCSRALHILPAYPLSQSGKVKLELKVTDMMVGDAKSCVPRCVSGAGGNINLDATNKKVWCSWAVAAAVQELGVGREAAQAVECACHCRAHSQHRGLLGLSSCCLLARHMLAAAGAALHQDSCLQQEQEEGASLVCQSRLPTSRSCCPT